MLTLPSALIGVNVVDMTVVPLDRDRTGAGPAGAYGWTLPVRRMRTKATGMAARAVSPHTHRARWNPPVRAAAVAYPWWASVREYEAAMDEATATPIAAPKFCEVLTRPAATPASRSVTPARAPMEIGMKANAVPI